MMLFRGLLWLFLCQWIMAQNPEDTTTTEMMSSTEMESTEDEMTSTFDSDSSSGSGSESGGGSMSIEGGEESDESGSSSGLSTTDDSGSSDSDEVESSEGGSSSNGGGMNPEDNNEDDGEDESASDDNDSDEDESAGDDGEAMESEEDDQDTDEESTEGPEDGDTEDNDQVDVAGEGEDECVGLDADECGNTFGDDGAQLCGYNTQTDDCYEVVMTVGIRGRGNFDDGYTAAQEEADEQAAQLYTAIGVLGGILALLVLTVLGGAYYVHSNRKHVDYRHTAVPHDIIDVDGGSTRTKGQHSRIESHSVHYSTDSIPMLDTN